MSQARVARPDLDRCPACANSVGCGVVKGETSCWCFDLPHRMPMPTNEEGARCYCRSCLERLVADQTASANTETL